MRFQDVISRKWKEKGFLESFVSPFSADSRQQAVSQVEINLIGNNSIRCNVSTFQHTWIQLAGHELMNNRLLYPCVPKIKMNEIVRSLEIFSLI